MLMLLANLPSAISVFKASEPVSENLTDGAGSRRGLSCDISR